MSTSSHAPRRMQARAVLVVNAEAKRCSARARWQARADVFAYVERFYNPTRQEGRASKAARPQGPRCGRPAIGGSAYGLVGSAAARRGRAPWPSDRHRPCRPRPGFGEPARPLALLRRSTPAPSNGPDAASPIPYSTAARCCALSEAKGSAGMGTAVLL